MNDAKILVVDDEPTLSEVISYNLRQAGYATVTAADADEALRIFKEEKPDLILLDVMLPQGSGFDVCRLIRQQGSNVPIIMLTARIAESDRVLGFELGADDYVTKPYSSRELIARIRAVLRRGELQDADVEGATLEVGPVRMDTDRHIISVNGEVVAIPLKEFELLEFLMRNAGRVLTRVQLIDRVWGSDYVGDTKTLDVHIKRLRAKIEKDPANPEFIQTVRGMGYKMERSN